MNIRTQGTTRWRVLATGFVLVGLLTLTAGLVSAASAQRSAITPPARIAKAGKLVICTDWINPPVEFKNSSGKLMGTDISTGAAIARLLGVKVVWLDIGFDGLIGALNGNKCDAIMAEMANKPERRKVVDFVNYASVGNILMTSKAHPVSIKSSTSLEELSGKTAATQIGTFPADVLAATNKKLKAAGKPLIKVVLLQNQADEVLTLRTGKTDVVIDTATAVGYYITLHPKQFEIASPPLNLLSVGIATRKNDRQLHAAIQKAVNAMYANGSMCTILKRWNVTSIALVPHKC